MSTFVSIGNALQPFSRLLQGVAQIAVELPQPVVVQCGNTNFAAQGCISKQFMSMSEFTEHMFNASLVILHAGAGSVIHALGAQKMPVVMPRLARYGEHVDDHQIEFARALASMRRVLVAEKPDDLLNLGKEAIKLQRGRLRVRTDPPMVGLISHTLLLHAQRLAQGR